MKAGIILHIHINGLLGFHCDLDHIPHSESRSRKTRLWSSSSEPTGPPVAKFKSQETAFGEQNPFAGIKINHDPSNLQDTAESLIHILEKKKG